VLTLLPLLLLLLQVADSAALKALHDDEGSTLQLHQPQRFFDPCWHLLAALERQLGCLVGSNAYLTPAGSQVGSTARSSCNDGAKCQHWCSVGGICSSAPPLPLRMLNVYLPVFIEPGALLQLAGRVAITVAAILQQQLCSNGVMHDTQPPTTA
jgi:hypothetical protein